MRLLILKNAPAPAALAPDTEVVTFDDVRGWVADRSVLRRLFSYDEVELITNDLRLTTRPFITRLVVRGLGRRAGMLVDVAGGRQKASVSAVLSAGARYLRDSAAAGGLLRHAHGEAEALGGSRLGVPCSFAGRPLYLRTDLAFGVRSGGSLGHIAGVVNNLGAFGGSPVFVTNDPIPTVAADIETRLVRPPDRFRDFPEVWALACNEPLVASVADALGRTVPSFVYQRYSHNNYAGLRLARRYGVPFVLEYNGSEVWMARNWGRPLKHEALAEEIELANLHGADLVVVVSTAMRDELVGRGIDAAKVLVNFNGVDPDVYSPAVDGADVRRRLGLDGKTVIGFIGTFGRWHGAEVLAEAFGRLVAAHPRYREDVRLLMIGDGVTMPEVRAAIAAHGIGDLVVLTGLVPQAEGPSYLAACDVLASPHVPNPDGTPFFGSPTKLFEYMAMGTAIVASDLDQIGEVLQHDRTAWMVAPGDADALAEGLRVLLDDGALRARLGEAARADAVARHTWREHTARIIDALKERCTA